MGILWPLVVVTCGGVVGGTAALWIKFRCSDSTCVLPRLVLIQALQENMDRLQLEMESKTWDDFAFGLGKNLDAIKQELIPIDARRGNGLNKFMKVIDAKLVNLLKAGSAETGVTSILDSYLPRAGQTWNSFLQNKTREEQLFFGVETSEQFPHSELKEYLLGSIEELKSTLEQSIATDPNRSGDDGKVETITQRYKIVKILYATDRQVTTNGEYIGKISTRSSPNLHYGWIEVGIPDIHKLGSLERPAERFTEADSSKHVVIFSVNTNPRGNFEMFLECISDDLAAIGDGTGELLVYIHGYNARHLDSVKRAAQLKDDLKFKGTVVLYSWSSKGTLPAYVTDAKNVGKTASSLKAFLREIMHKVKAPRVHILAHSMGNRALVAALVNLDAQQKGESLPRCPLSQIIFVAADEERSRFEELLRKLNERYKPIAPVDLSRTSGSSGRMDEDLNSSKSGAVEIRPHLTVYCSVGDWPLMLSGAFRGEPRLGNTLSLFTSIETTLGEHDIIDASDVKEGSFKHHSYHLESPSVIRDIGNLLAQKTPASRRSNLQHIPNFKGRSFYAFNARRWTS